MRLALLAACGLLASPAFADEPALFEGLAGACWRAAVDDRGTTDTHCFSAAAGGKLAMDVHKVRDAKGAVVYEGVTVYRPAGARWRFEYSNAFGDLITGEAARAGTELHFWSKPEAPAPDTVWRLEADAYVVAGKAGEAGMRFRRVGAVEGGL